MINNEYEDTSKVCTLIKKPDLKSILEVNPIEEENHLL
jgi:hypothetical protein